MLKFVVTAVTCGSLFAPCTALAEDWTGTFISFGVGQSDSSVDWNTGASIPFFAPGDYQGKGEDSGTAYSLEFGEMYGSDNFLYGWTVGLTQVNHDQEETLFGDTTHSDEISPIFSVAGRVGRGFGNWLIYGEAGVAVTKISVDNSLPYCPGGCSLELEETSTGWLGGVGVDYRLGELYSVGLNYRHFDFDEQSMSGTVSGLGGPQSYDVSGDTDVVTLRFTVAFH